MTTEELKELKGKITPQQWLKENGKLQVTSQALYLPEQYEAECERFYAGERTATIRFEKLADYLDRYAKHVNASLLDECLEMRAEQDHLRKECERLDADADKWMARAAKAEKELESFRAGTQAVSE